MCYVTIDLWFIVSVCTYIELTSIISNALWNGRRILLYGFQSITYTHHCPRSTRNRALLRWCDWLQMNKMFFFSMNRNFILNTFRFNQSTFLLRYTCPLMRSWSSVYLQYFSICRVMWNNSLNNKKFGNICYKFDAIRAGLAHRATGNFPMGLCQHAPN